MKSIKTKLIASFSILILAITLVIGMISIQSGYRSLRKEAEKSLKALAEEEAKLTESRMETLITTLQIIAKKKEIVHMGWKVNLATLKEELKKTSFLDIGYVMSDGYAYYTDGTVRLMSDRNYVKKAMEGKSSMSDVIISRVTRKPEIEICVPITRNGKVTGALVARTKADTLGAITKDAGYGSNGYAFIINSSGRVIAYPDNNKVVQMFNPIDAAKKDQKLVSMSTSFQTMLNKKSGVTSYQQNGTDFMAGFAPISGTDWVFAITADKSEVFSVIPGMIRNIIIVMGIVFLLSFIIVFLLDQTITGPLIGITKLSKQIADLNLSENISHIYLKQRDEIGTLSGTFQTLTEKLREIITQISDSANQVSASAQELSAASLNSSRNSEEISFAVENIAKGAYEQAESTEGGQNNAAILGAMIEKNHGYVIHLNNTTEQVNDLVNAGLMDIEKLSASAKESSRVTEEIYNIILQTQKSSEKISEASKMISDMAKQTNLLALNASIEAARAGEAGKGFAVVADEIQKMADQSAVSTKYIDDIIAGLQQNVKSSAESMKCIKVTASEQQSSVNKAVQKYQTIAEAMDVSKKAVTELNASEKDMKDAKDRILDMLQSLSAIAEQNAAGTQQAASFVEKQTVSAKALADTSAKLSELACDLQSVIDRFHI